MGWERSFPLEVCSYFSLFCAVTRQHYVYVIFIALFYLLVRVLDFLAVSGGGGDTKQLHLCSLHVDLPTVFTLECDTYRKYYQNFTYRLPLHSDRQCNCVF